MLEEIPFSVHVLGRQLATPFHGEVLAAHLARFVADLVEKENAREARPWEFVLQLLMIGPIQPHCHEATFIFAECNQHL